VLGVVGGFGWQIRMALPALAQGLSGRGRESPTERKRRTVTYFLREDRFGRYTAWELQQIVRNRKWFDKTDFYREGRKLTQDELLKLGIK
jgi:hypothetical protein